jgi:ataxia telangiectasia mutated family protein
LEKPDVIIQKYLTPAVKDLHGRLEGEEAGRVFHEFAKFCDQQLQNPDLLEDFRRIEQLRLRKEQEVLDFEEMMKSTQGRERDQLRVYRNKARQWFELDDREYQRLKRSRGSLLEQCLENYLLSLNACDVFKNDVLRFCALWLDNSDSDIANASVSKYLGQIPSRKFAPLLSQLSSRLLDTDDAFQQLLSPLIFRICIEHPYHGMYQLFSSSKTKGGKDETSMSRFRAAGKLVEQAKSHPTAGPTWVTVHNTCISYARFAMDRLEEKIKSGSKVLLRKSATGQRLEQDVARQKIPPPTMKIELRVDCDYSQLPRVVKFLPEFTVASGVSAPKIVTAIGSDGKQYKQLVSGFNFIP